MCSLSGGRHKPDDNTPLSYWLNERHGCSNNLSTACVQSACVTKSARAIVSSGRPYPNEVRDNKTGELISYDVWIGAGLYKMQSDGFIFARSEWYPKSHPLAYSRIRILIGDLLEISDSDVKRIEIDGTLEGRVGCADLAANDDFLMSKDLIV